MKNKIVIILLTVSTLLMFVYAYVQKLEADVQKEHSVAAQIEAEKNFTEAEMQRKIATVNQARAMELEQALMKCNSEKK